MRTFMLLKNVHTVALPEEFRDRDVRYPDSLVEHFVRAYTGAGAAVFDPFAGYGTTLRVAEALGRAGYGIERDPRVWAYAREQLRHPERLIHGTALELAAHPLPPLDFSLTSPPYMHRDEVESPLGPRPTTGAAYAGYLEDIGGVYRQLAARMRTGAHAVIEVANLKGAQGVTTLAWDIGRAVAAVLHFEGEVVVGWDRYGYGYDHSYCLVFRK
jgi:SAM-dependent methyltransferase